MKVARRFLIVFTLVTAGFAQGPWVKKDWKDWSKDDCRKVLEDSPWAQRWSQSDSKSANFATRNRGTEGVGSESELTVYYLVQLRSAKPVREAVVRQVFIANRYDDLEPPQQESMRKQTDAFLNRTYDDVIVVHVIYGSNVQEYNRALATFWQTHYAEGTVPQEAFLNGPRGQKITPLKLISHKGGDQEFELIFPRLVDGKPLLEPGDKSMSVEFSSPALSRDTATARDPGAGSNPVAGNSSATSMGVDSARVFTEFKVDKMTVKGQLIY